MKTKFGIILILICLIALSSDAFAIDYTFKTTVTRIEARSVVPDNSPNCDGSTPALPTINYNVTLIDSNFTQFTIKIFKKSDNSSYFGPTTVAVTHGGNFDLATGELTYTINGIPKTNEILIVRFYKGASAAGSPDAEQEISISSNTRPQAGFINIGDIGVNDNSTNALGTFGGIITGGTTFSNSASDSYITVNFPTQEDTDYIVNISYQSLGTVGFDNDVRMPVIYNKTTSSFQVYIEELSAVTQNLRLDIILQHY